MKITYISDIHQEFHNINKLNHLAEALPKADVLVIAGDTAEANNYFNNKTKAFFNLLSSKYRDILMVMGNHEFYQADLTNVRTSLPEMVNSTWNNIRILDNQQVKIGNVLFIGSTLWTNINDANPLNMINAAMMMNDYRIITIEQCSRTLTPEDTIKEFYHSREFIENTLTANPKTKTVIVTHHAPSHLSIDKQYMTKQQDILGLNHCYYSPLDNIIEKNTQIRVWIHGHVHSPMDYEVGKTRVLCNPVGYYYDDKQQHSVIEI